MKKIIYFMLLTALTLSLGTNRVMAEGPQVDVVGTAVWLGAVDVQSQVAANGAVLLSLTQYWQVSGSLNGILSEHVEATFWSSGYGIAKSQTTFTTDDLSGTLTGHAEVRFEPVNPAISLYHGIGSIEFEHGDGVYAGYHCRLNIDFLTYHSASYTGKCVVPGR
jgi:hypothetical protein